MIKVKRWSLRGVLKLSSSRLQVAFRSLQGSMKNFRQPEVQDLKTTWRNFTHLPDISQLWVSRVQTLNNNDAMKSKHGAWTADCTTRLNSRTLPEEWPLGLNSMIWPPKLNSDCRVCTSFVRQCTVTVIFVPYVWTIFQNIFKISSILPPFEHLTLKSEVQNCLKLLIQCIVTTAFEIKNEITVLPMIRFSSSNRIL